MDAGWYIDPLDPTSGRFHDGAAWTDDTVAIPAGKTLPGAPASETPFSTSAARSGSTPPSTSTSPSTSAPQYRRRRLFAASLVVVALLAAVGITYAVTRNGNSSPSGQSATQVEGASETKVPGHSAAACRLAFDQQLSLHSPADLAPAPLAVCTPQDWMSVYQAVSADLGQRQVNATAALQAACRSWESGAIAPPACRGVSESTTTGS